MSDYKLHGKKTNIASFDALPGYWWGQDKAAQSRCDYKRTLRRNRRRYARAVVRQQLVETE